MIRKRIKSYTPNITAGGGGPPPSTIAGANVQWGPHFGQSTQLKQQGLLKLVRQTLSGFRLRQDARFSTYRNTVTYRVRQNGSVRMPQLTYTNNRQKAEADISRLEYFMSEIRPSKDTYANVDVNVLGNCVDTANHNGEQLYVNTEALVTSAKKRSFVGFDLSGFSPNATVTSATLVMNLTTVSAALGAAPATIDLNNATTATENWNEATLVCSNAPSGVGGGGMLYTQSTVLGDTAINVTPLATRIANRMGTTLPLTFIFAAVTTGTTFGFQSKDAPAGSTANSPRLRLRWTVPT